ncbi:MAG: tetratricopeptide repeat protein [Treponema sp.]|jgi:tetratricopeptide (TPR) repeat protein|nr:tetratricopeptide repeat protein [Treponema sp.]
MTGFLRHIFFRLLDCVPFLRRETAETSEAFWEADFSGPDKAYFDIKSENAYDAYLQKGEGRSALGIGLKKTNCLAWVEGLHHYRDLLITARLRLETRGGYGAAGIMFRLLEGPSGKGTYYLVLLSSKAYFRLDAVLNNTPLALIGWTEFALPRAASPDIELTVIAYGAHITLLINGIWAGEISDSSIDAGSLGFALASYEAPPAFGGTYAAEAFLEYLSVDTRISEVEKAWRTWDEGKAVPAENRLHLAETFTAMGKYAAGLAQLKKLWQGRNQRREGRELLLAARLAFALELYDEAEGYVDACLAGEGAEANESLVQAQTEKAKILYAGKRLEELRDFAEKALVFGDAALAALLGHAYWELGDFEKAAPAYGRAFELDGENGLHAANAANVYEALGRKTEALDYYLAAGRAYLRAENYPDLGTLIPKLLALGPERWEAHALAGKWAFGIEDWQGAGREFKSAEKYRKKAEREGPAKDPALSFLRGLLLIREGRRREALPLLQEAADLAPDYGLFRFRLAETRYLLKNDPRDKLVWVDLEKALALLDPGREDRPNSPGEAGTPGGPGETGQAREAGQAGEDRLTWGWANNLAAQLSLAGGDLDRAAAYLDRAAAALGETAPVLVNRGVYHYLRGSLDEALAILEADSSTDSEGLLANCAGNLLTRAGQFEKADAYYQKALAIRADNTEFLLNRASCLIEMGAYGEADTLLARAHRIAPSPGVLELIAYVAVKKGEYPRAESACRAALEMDGGHAPSLHSLGWIYRSTGRWEEAQETLARLDKLELSGEDAERREELRQGILEGTTRLIPCATCGRTWRVPLDPPPAPALRLRARPPDELPAGTCPSCGASYCIGCAKERVDAQGRFICPACGVSLKLINEGLRKIVAAWAEGRA